MCLNVRHDIGLRRIKCRFGKNYSDVVDLYHHGSLGFASLHTTLDSADANLPIQLSVFVIIPFV